MTVLGDYLADRTPAYFATAACRTVQVRQAIAAGEVNFFPTRTDKPAPVRRAKLICGDCPSRIECLAEAMANHFKGIWGGLSEEERTHIRRGHSAA